MKKLTLLTLALSLSITAYSQQVKTDTVVKAKSFFVNAGLQYISNLTYAGRRDASSVPILLPTATLIYKKGLFLNVAGYFNVSTGGSQTEGLSVTPGYVFSFGEKKYYGGALSATKFFITNDSPIILSSFNASFDAQLYANPNDIVKLTAAGSYRLGKNNVKDLINNLDLSKEVTLMKPTDKHRSLFKINPTLSLIAGTQSFFQTYFTNSEVQREVQKVTTTYTTEPGQGILGFLFPVNTSKDVITTTIINETVTEEHQQEVRKYQLLAASASLPLTYQVKKVQFVATPYFIRPINQINYVDNTAMNGMYFMFTVGVNATF